MDYYYDQLSQQQTKIINDCNNNDNNNNNNIINNNNNNVINDNNIDYDIDNHIDTIDNENGIYIPNNNRSDYSCVEFQVLFEGTKLISSMTFTKDFIESNVNNSFSIEFPLNSDDAAYESEFDMECRIRTQGKIDVIVIFYKGNGVGTFNSILSITYHYETKKHCQSQIEEEYVFKDDSKSKKRNVHNKFETLFNNKTLKSKELSNRSVYKKHHCISSYIFKREDPIDRNYIILKNFSIEINTNFLLELL
jgi:ribosomal protein L23